MSKVAKTKKASRFFKVGTMPVVVNPSKGYFDIQIYDGSGSVCFSFWKGEKSMTDKDVKQLIAAFEEGLAFQGAE